MQEWNKVNELKMKQLEMRKAKEEEEKAKMMVEANQCTPPKKITKIQQKFTNIKHQIQLKEQTKNLPPVADTFSDLKKGASKRT